MSQVKPAGIAKWAFVIPVVALLVTLVTWGQRPDGKMRLWVLDVGQGNAALLRTPHGHTAVIDGGPGGTALNEGVGRHLPFWQNNLDLVLLSAPKSENVSGLVDLLGRRKVSQIVQTPFETTTGLLGAWREAIEQSGAPAYYAQRGDVIRFDGEPEVALRVLYPARERQGPIVLKVEYGGISILLAASLEKEDETRLLDIAEEGELTSEVLVVPDHGSDTALSPRLLAAVDPTVAVISVGVGNRGEDPAPEVLQRLQEAGARVYRTDTNGTIEVTVDDGKLWVGSER